jgi:hypothetical protein
MAFRLRSDAARSLFVVDAAYREEQLPPIEAGANGSIRRDGPKLPCRMFAPVSAIPRAFYGNFMLTAISQATTRKSNASTTV